MSAAARVLLTGGCGYIGSHTACEFLRAGYEVVLYDDLSNSRLCTVDRIKLACGYSPIFEEGDILDTERLREILQKYSIGSVVHFAGLKSAVESVSDVVRYYRVNVGGSLSLLEAMRVCGVRRLLYSSSALVYGEARGGAFVEDGAVCPPNPYGRSKWLVEQILADSVAEFGGSFCSLRYFNPIGAHPSGLLGEDPVGESSNLLPLLLSAASGSEVLSVFGDDYATADGTCIRDYIDIGDLATGHVSALRFLFERSGYECFNLGSGRGFSVLEIISAFESATGMEVDYRIADRREGDVAISVSSVAKAERILGWRARRGLEDMLLSAWRWHKNRVEE